MADSVGAISAGRHDVIYGDDVGTKAYGDERTIDDLLAWPQGHAMTVSNPGRTVIIDAVGINVYGEQADGHTRMTNEWFGVYGHSTSEIGAVARVEIGTPSDGMGIFARDSGGDEVFALAVEDGVSWDSLTLNTGDMMLGRGSAILLWDDDAEQLLLGDTGADHLIASGSALEFWRDTTKRASYSEDIQLYDGAGVERVHIDNDGSGWFISASGGNSIRWTAAGVVSIEGDGSGLTSIAGGNITTGSITADQLDTEYATVATLEASYITAGTIASTYATISTLTTSYLTASTISSTYATIDTLTTTYLEIADATDEGNIVATINASTEGIEINAAKVNFSGVVSVGGSAADINSGTTTISGGKITASTITADQITGTTLSAIYADMGTLTAGQVALLATGTSISGGDATGLVIDDSLSYDSDTWHLLSFNDGDWQVGIGTDGKFYAGEGSTCIGNTGIRLVADYAWGLDDGSAIGWGASVNSAPMATIGASYLIDPESINELRLGVEGIGAQADPYIKIVASESEGPYVKLSAATYISLSTAWVDTSGRITTAGGVHVGGTSNPGDNNLIVDGTVKIGTRYAPTVASSGTMMAYGVASLGTGFDNSTRISTVTHGLTFSSSTSYIAYAVVTETQNSTPNAAIYKTHEVVPISTTQFAVRWEHNWGSNLGAYVHWFVIGT